MSFSRQTLRRILASLLALAIGFGALFCDSNRGKIAKEKNRALGGAELTIKKFTRKAYKKKKVQWFMRSERAYMFFETPASKKSEDPKIRQKEEFQRLAQDDKLQRVLVAQIVKTGQAPMDLAGKTLVVKFDVDHYKKGKPQTNMVGNYGYVVNSTKDLHLEGNVIAKSVDGRLLKTPYLNYDATTEKLTTKAEVHIETEDGIMDGVGMEASSDLTYIKILHPTGYVERE